jgi:hypothetical protein
MAPKTSTPTTATTTATAATATAPTITTTTRAIEKAYDLLNDDIYQGALPRPVIVVKGNAARCDARRQVSIVPVWHDTENAHHEMCIFGEFLNSPANTVAATIAAAMVEYGLILAGTPGTSRNGHYYNARFRRGAEAAGFSFPEKPAGNGWDNWSIGKDLALSIEKAAKALVEIDLYREFDELPTKKTRRAYRHECPVCGLKATTGKPATLICGGCNVAMKAK